MCTWKIPKCWCTVHLGDSHDCWVHIHPHLYTKKIRLFPFTIMTSTSETVKRLTWTFKSEWIVLEENKHAELRKVKFENHCTSTSVPISSVAVVTGACVRSIGILTRGTAVTRVTRSTFVNILNRSKRTRYVQQFSIQRIPIYSLFLPLSVSESFW